MNVLLQEKMVFPGDYTPILLSQKRACDLNEIYRLQFSSAHHVIDFTDLGNLLYGPVTVKEKKIMRYNPETQGIFSALYF